MKNKFYFNSNVAKKYLGKKLYSEYLEVQKNANVSTKFAQKFSVRLIKWAKSLKVDYFCHWFVPLSGKPAFKYVKFFNEQKNCLNFDYKTLMRCEADASSFPSFPERDTAKARGLIFWDGSPIFVKDDNGARVMFLPSLLFSPNGVSLDYKTPLKKSEAKLDEIATNLANLFGINCSSASVQLGAEQEFFLVDKIKAESRADIKLLNIATLNENPQVEQSITLHYFSEPQKNIKQFMFSLNKRLKEIGVFAEVMHSEVASNQFEVVPKFTCAYLACQQNHVIISIIKNIAEEFGFLLLFTEKPFMHYNGSGKHNNLSVITNTGVNLFDCNNIVENLFKVAVVAAISEYPELYKICTTSMGNERRLGGKEAPPSIISLHLGELKQFDDYGNLVGEKQTFCDRNRTSPFAFNGNKWEFRMVGSSADCSFACMVFCSTIAYKLQQYYNILKDSNNLVIDVKKLLTLELQKHQKVIYNADNYSHEWVNLARKLELYNKTDPIEVYKDFLLDKNIELFKDLEVLSLSEMQVIYNNLMQRYKSEVIACGKVTSGMLTEIFWNINNNLVKNNCCLDEQTQKLILILKEHKQKLDEQLKSKVTDKIYTKITSLLQKIDEEYAALAEALPSPALGIVRVEELLNC